MHISTLQLPNYDKDIKKAVANNICQQPLYRLRIYTFR